MAYGHHEVDPGCRLDRARRSTRFRFLAGPVAVAARRGWPLDTSRSARSGRWPGCPPSIPRKARLRAAGTDSPGGERAGLHRRRIRIARCGNSGSKRGNMHSSQAAVQVSKCPSADRSYIGSISKVSRKRLQASTNRPNLDAPWTLKDGSGTLANCVRCLCHAGLDTWTLHRGMRRPMTGNAPRGRRIGRPCNRGVSC